MSRLWDKGDPVDDLVLRFTVGDDPVLDRRLLPYDVRASVAHARMLREAGYLATADFEAIREGLGALAASFARGEWTIGVEDEDVHTALETRLVDRIGEAGRRVHLGRSRNDQVLAALRLYLLDAATELHAIAGRVATELEGVAARQGAIPLPGYTHFQRAMPSSVALWAGGFRAEIEDDREGLLAARRRLQRNPLGSAAGYGTPGLELDRTMTTEPLGFASEHEPVTAVQLSRGKGEAALVFECCLLMQDLGRLASELVLFATSEFGFVRLPARFTTGSSIMPQKRNPDVFELVRARAAVLPADLAAILALCAKLPSGYHRDLQLLKAPLFRALDSTSETALVMAHALPELLFDESRCRAAASDPGLRAAEEANRLVVERGLAFRDAYREVAARLKERTQD